METMTPQPASSFRPIPTESPQAQLDDLLTRICEALQLSQSQHDIAAERYAAVGGWLAAPGSSLAKFRPEIYSQGSLRIGTTTKPLKRQEYDLDAVAEFQVAAATFPQPVVLLDLLERRLREHSQYKTMLERKNRCIRLNYANEFHIDFLPACPDTRLGGTCLLVPDRSVGAWKESNPKGFARWFDGIAESALALAEKAVERVPDREAVSEKAALRLAVQLLKRWRDMAFYAHEDLAPSSILLTTLAATYYHRSSSIGKAMSAVLRGIASALPAGGAPLVVVNPTNRQEILSECWEKYPQGYALFVDRIRALRTTWERLQDPAGGLASIGAILAKLFGKPVTQEALKAHAASIQTLRESRSIGVRRGTGTLAALNSVNVKPVRPNTFYGA